MRRLDGSAAGKRTLVNTCHSVAVSDRQSRSMPLSTLRNPAVVAITTGKKAMKTEKAMRDWAPTPSQMMNSGASAIFGMSWKKIKFG